MSTFTDKELIKEIKERIGSLDVRDDIERRAYEIALASLEAEPVAWKTTFTQISHECNTYTVTYFDKAEAERWVHIHNITGEFRAEVVPFYTAPPVSIVQLPFEQWLEQQREKIEVDCGCVSTETLMHWMRMAYEAGDSPVTPDGWISCSERMPDKLIPVMVMYEDGEMWSAMWNGNRWDDGTEYPDPHSVTHWREMPAAPQQEVK
ncbi:TPA: DUF551 domain-containing protein [Escherichia coli]|nr:DUF551 domain-containing protein [Escherichia coli]HDP7960794.1 DUF551 domain-containing protein [Escherichia coli]